jgi:DNA-binding CsgD family transcriptional regulator
VIPQNFLKTLAAEHGVSDSELEALWLAVDGNSTTAISQKLQVSEDAVRKRLSEVYRKFKVPGSGPVKLSRLQQLLVSRYQEHPAQRSSGSSSNLAGPGIENTYPRQLWGEAPDVSVFHGRIEELATLEQWIVKDGCRLVGLVGMAGIGKTILSVKLARQIQDKFEYLIWRSLRNALPIQEVLADLIKVLSYPQETNLPEVIDERVSQLIKYLRKHRCLLVLDDVETILRSGDRIWRYNEGYEGYGVLLKRVGEEQHQSCLVVSGLEKPREIGLLESPTGFVRSLQLTGLRQEAAQKILQEKGLTGEQQWKELIQTYRGNPLALKIVATTIQDLFSSNVSEFLRHKTIIVSDMFREILNWQFKRLSNLEKEIVYNLAIEINPVSFLKLRENMPTSLTSSELIEALESLGWKSLVERTKSSENKDPIETLFTLQPVIKKYVIKYYLPSNPRT